MMNKGKIGAVATGAAIVVGLTGLVMCTERVPAGYVGVVYNMNGGVQEETLSQGFHLVSPTKKVVDYSIAIEQGYLSKDKLEGDPDDSSFDIPTSDGKTINVDMEYSYHFEPENIATVFTQFKGQDGKDIEKNFIRGKLKSWSGEVSSTFPVTDIFGDKRIELNRSVQEHVSEKFKPYGIIVDSVSFTRVETDAKTAAAIQKKVNAQQELELARIEAETAEVQANKDKEVALIAAEKEKEVALINAERDKEVAVQNAEAARVHGEGIAASNRAIAESLTPELLERQKYEKWDGKLPQVQGSSDSNMIVDIRE